LGSAPPTNRNSKVNKAKQQTKTKGCGAKTKPSEVSLWLNEVTNKLGKDLTAVETQPQSKTSTGDNEIAKDKKGKPGISFYTEPHYKRLLKWPEHTKLVNPFEFLKWALRTRKTFGNLV
jgi:hypothetical protein